MKTCKTCGVDKPLEDFQKRSRSKDGHTSMCKDCKRTYDNDHYNRNPDRKLYISNNRKASLDAARAWIHDYLSEHPCIDCGESDIVVLDFDHVKDTKRNSVSRLKRSSLRAVQLEVKKCEVRCANCHRRKTAKQFGWHIPTPP